MTFLSFSDPATQKLLLVALAFLAVAMMAYGVSQLVLRATDGDARLMRRRLTVTGGRPKGDQFNPAKYRVVHDLDDEFPGWTARFKTFGPLRSLALSLQQSMPDVGLDRFLSLMGGLFAGAAVLAFVLRGSLFVALVAGLVVGCVPLLVMVRRKSRRQRDMEDQLPNALDFLGRALRAGHSLTTAWAMLGTELPDPLAAEFRRCHDRHALGIDLDTCLRQMTQRIESVDFAFFITAVLIQRQTGGDLAGVLDNIGDMIRQRIRLQKTVKAKTAEGRFTGYILTVFPMAMFVILYMMNPEYAGILLEEPAGRMLMGGSIVLQALGLFMIQKLTTLKV